MRIFVLTNNIRKLDKSYNQIIYTLYIDVSNNKYWCYLDLLKEIKDIKEDVLILEDDLILCQDFLNHIEPIINQYKGSIINFFWQPLRTIKKTTIEKKGFCYTQCVYYPEGMINKFYKDLQKSNFAYDKNIRQALEKNNISFVNVRPHYVQHIGDESLIYPGLYARRSSQFIDDLKN